MSEILKIKVGSTEHDYAAEENDLLSEISSFNNIVEVKFPLDETVSVVSSGIHITGNKDPFRVMITENIADGVIENPPFTVVIHKAGEGND